MAGSQLNPALNSNISVILEKVFVATGVDIKFKYGLEAEIIDLKNEDSKCQLLINFSSSWCITQAILPVPMAEARKENADVTVIVVC